LGSDLSAGAGVEKISHLHHAPTGVFLGRGRTGGSPLQVVSGEYYITVQGETTAEQVDL